MLALLGQYKIQVFWYVILMHRTRATVSSAIQKARNPTLMRIVWRTRIFRLSGNTRELSLRKIR